MALQEEKARFSGKSIQEKLLVYTAQSVRNFAYRMLICKHVLDMGYVPLNPFNLWGHYLYELVDRDVVRNANNNLIRRVDEVWVFGDISDGVLPETNLAKESGKPVRYFNIDDLPRSIVGIEEDQVRYEEGVHWQR